MFPGVKLGVMIVASVVIPIAYAVILPAHNVSASAAADTPATLKNAETHFCLDSNGKDVIIGSCNGGRSQQWDLDTGGTTLKNMATKLCLESNDSKLVYTNDCSNSNSYQKWVLGNGTTLRNRATGFCLDSNVKLEVYANQCDDSASQKWSGI